MELKELFEMQKELDSHIIKEKGLEGQDLLPQKILALQVELGELANEWRGFKFWSRFQEPRREIRCHACEGKGEFTKEEPCLYCESTGIERRPLLEEYVDCLHFFLSIANTINMPVEYLYGPDEILVETTENILVEIIYYISKVLFTDEIEKQHLYLKLAFWIFLALGEQRFDFEYEQIVQAYKEKNQVNHERQENGY